MFILHLTEGGICGHRLSPGSGQARQVEGLLHPAAESHSPDRKRLNAAGRAYRHPHVQIRTARERRDQALKSPLGWEEMPIELASACLNRSRWSPAPERGS